MARIKRMGEVHYDSLPAYMRAGAERYVETGDLPGHFLQAVLSNNLVEAFGKADGENTASMQNWAYWLHNECPSLAWGSREKMLEWNTRGGLVGICQEGSDD